MDKAAQLQGIRDAIRKRWLDADDKYEPLPVDEIADILYAAGYRKLPEKPKVLSDEEIVNLWRQAWISDKRFGELVAQAQLEADIRHCEGKDA